MLRYLTLFALVLFVAPPAFAATLYIDPDEGKYGVGDTFVAAIRLNPEGECVNAVNVSLLYPQETLKAVDFSRGSSIVSLWVEEPKIDESGKVTFSGGIPGGYCGRVQGDPSISNVLGKVVFTVTGASSQTANVHFSNASMLYANDGLGTKVVPTLNSASFSISPDRQLPDNEWLKAVEEDKIPPEKFPVTVESTKDVFGGKYYIVFSTVDKQSGMDHFEIKEQGTWKPIESPYELRDQTLRSGIDVRAIDKAGNERLGDYTPGSAPELQAQSSDFTLFLVGFGVLVLIAGARAVLRRTQKEEVQSDPQGPPSA